MPEIGRVAFPENGVTIKKIRVKTVSFVDQEATSTRNWEQEKPTHCRQICMTAARQGSGLRSGAKDGDAPPVIFQRLDTGLRYKLCAARKEAVYPVCTRSRSARNLDCRL